MVETAVGLCVRPRATESAPSSAPSLGRCSRSGVRVGLLSRSPESGRSELGAVLEHGVHDDRKAAGKCDPCLSHV